MRETLEGIVEIPYDESHYFKATYPKTQIVLHHTVSNGSAQAVADYWSTLENRVGTPMVIDKAGVIHNLFNSRFYAGHVGETVKEMKKFNLPERSCSKMSLGVELVNMGGLIQRESKLIDEYGHEFKGDTIHYPNKFRGFEYFAKYPQVQIDALRRLLVYWCDTFDISKTYNPDIWDVSFRALRGDPGIFCHTSFVSERKSDLHPQPEIISMLKSL